MKILRNKRMLLAMMLSLVLAFGSCITVCAEADYSNYLKSAPNDEQYPYKLVFKYMDTGKIALVCSDAPLTAVYTSVYPSGCVNDKAPVKSFNLYHWNGSEWVYSRTTQSMGNCVLGSSKSALLISNYDIRDTNGDVFFQAPVTPLVRVAMGITPEQILKEIVKLLPIVIVTVVGYLALRKGLSMLFNRLRKA